MVDDTVVEGRCDADGDQEEDKTRGSQEGDVPMSRQAGLFRIRFNVSLSPIDRAEHVMVEGAVFSVSRNRHEAPETDGDDSEEDELEIVGVASPLAPFRGDCHDVPIEGDHTGQEDLHQGEGHVGCSICHAAPFREGSSEIKSFTSQLTHEACPS